MNNNAQSRTIRICINILKGVSKQPVARIRLEKELSNWIKKLIQGRFDWLLTAPSLRSGLRFGGWLTM